MFTKRTGLALVRYFAIVSLVATCSSTNFATAQQLGNTPLEFKVETSGKRMEMIVNSSRILTLGEKIPRMVVNNPGVVKATPLAANKIQLSGLQPGVTQVNLWGESGKIHTIDIIVYGDARQLAMLLEVEFPNSSLKVRPLVDSVVISGYIDRPDYVSRIVRMAEDYFPKVINNITVGGVQQVLLNVKVIEVSRTKLRRMGVDFANVNGNDFLISSVSGLINAAAVSSGSAGGLGGDTVRFGVLNGTNSFFGFMELLRDNGVAKILAEPTFTTVSGRPAFFEIGGEFPILVPQSLGTTTIEYKKFGTQVDFVPIVLGNGNIRLEVRPRVSERDAASGTTLGSTVVPGIRLRQVDTAVELKAGQTLALAGLLQERTETQTRGVPWLADLPWVGAAFRRNTDSVNEIELLITVQVEIVDAMAPHQMPPCGPGSRTKSPNDVDFYWRGHIEVPRCCDGSGCASCTNGQSQETYVPNGQPMIEQVQPQLKEKETPPMPSAGRSNSQFPGTSSYSPQYYPTKTPIQSNRYQTSTATTSDQGSRSIRLRYPNSPSVNSSTPASMPPLPGARTPGAETQVPDLQQPLLPPNSVQGAKPKLFGPIGYDVVKNR